MMIECPSILCNFAIRDHAEIQDAETELALTLCRYCGRRTKITRAMLVASRFNSSYGSL